MLYNNVLDVAGRIGYLEGSMSGGNNVYWRGSMGGLKLMPGDRYIDPQFKGSRLIPTANSPLVDAGRPAPMKKDLDGVRVGVDGNGDGQRGADIGAYEAKAKGHSWRQGPQGGKGHGGKAATAASTTATAARATTAGKGHTAATNHRLASAPKTWPGGPQGVGVPRARMGASAPNPRGSFTPAPDPDSYHQPGGGRKRSPPDVPAQGGRDVRSVRDVSRPGPAAGPDAPVSLDS